MLDQLGFSWLGITPYITSSAVTATLQFGASLSVAVERFLTMCFAVIIESDPTRFFRWHGATRSFLRGSFQIFFGSGEDRRHD